MSSSNSRLVKETADQKLVAGIQQFLMNLATMTVGSRQLTPAELAAIFQDRVASSQAVQTATASRAAAIKADRDKRAQTASLEKALKRLVQGMFSESPDTLAVFGLQPVKVGTKTVATKAAAVEKTLATRKARHTMGKRQKEEITGETASAGADATAGTPVPVKTGPP